MSGTCTLCTTGAGRAVKAGGGGVTATMLAAMRAAVGRLKRVVSVCILKLLTEVVELKQY
ncbi:hypothetical protein B5P44_24810 [Mycobacterium sp. CBMA 213]|nr:hypothetical protein [Mycolicibacterium sp. CBMA 213]